MKAIKIIKIVGLTTVTLLFVTLISSGFFFEATHKVTQEVLSPTDFNILQVETIIITALCITYTLLLFPWLLYFIKLEKKSGLQYLSLYPMTGKIVGKITAIALTVLNGVTAVVFYFLYLNYIKSSAEISANSQLYVLTLLCCAIIFWGGVYLVYGSAVWSETIQGYSEETARAKKTASSAWRVSFMSD